MYRTSDLNEQWTIGDTILTAIVEDKSAEVTRVACRGTHFPIAPVGRAEVHGQAWRFVTEPPTTHRATWPFAVITDSARVIDE